jgi:hypothetical protein
MFPKPDAPETRLEYFQGMRWVFPSMTASLVMLGSMGYVVWARCGPNALPFVITICSYAFMQLPTYEAIYHIGERRQSSDDLVTYLAFGKLLCGAFFYQVFPASVKKFDKLDAPILGTRWSDTGFGRVAKWTAITTAAAVLTAIVDGLARRIL